MERLRLVNTIPELPRNRTQLLLSGIVPTTLVRENREADTPLLSRREQRRLREGPHHVVESRPEVVDRLRVQVRAFVHSGLGRVIDIHIPATMILVILDARLSAGSPALDAVSEA